MGGQQFAEGEMLVDTRKLNRVHAFDKELGLITVDAGIQWLDLINYLNREQQGAGRSWAIRQKQTGVDKVCIGGSLASNIHGRGLTFPPLVSDIESFTLVDAAGETHQCSRRNKPELFSLAIGGYGLFGIVTQVTLRLMPRVKLRRVVEVIAVADLESKIRQRIEQGYLYGDCQYATHLDTPAEDHPGVFSCYLPVSDDQPVDENPRQMSNEEWKHLYSLARSDKPKAFETYAEYYQATSGQVYWSDTHQLSNVFEGYRNAVNLANGTEMITEVYVPRDSLTPFLAQARKDFVEHKIDMTYGTIRFIEPDAETFLPWAKAASACIVCNLHVKHSPAGIEKAKHDFRLIIDRAIHFGGRHYLTYHRWATRQQMESCYPQFVDFLRLKKAHDPAGRFQSDWHRHYAAIFSDKL